MACKIVAICGIDGAGKSTLWETMQRDRDFKHANFVVKRLRDNLDRVIESRVADLHDDDAAATALFSGSYANAIRWAHALDFLGHFDTVISPLLHQENLIVSDRWSFCPMAFADVGTSLGKDIRYLLEKVPQPDLTIFLDVSPATAHERIVRRGDLGVDERPHFLAAYQKAYEAIFAEVKRMVRVSGVTPEQSYHEARMAVWRYLGR